MERIEESEQMEKFMGAIFDKSIRPYAERIEIVKLFVRRTTDSVEKFAISVPIEMSEEEMNDLLPEDTKLATNAEIEEWQQEQKKDIQEKQDNEESFEL